MLTTVCFPESLIEFKQEETKMIGSESVLIELKHTEKDGPDPEIESNVGRLAELLKISASGSNLRTLPFRYYIHEPEDERMLSYLITHCMPRNLNQCLSTI